MVPISDLSIIAVHIPIAIITAVMFALALAGDRRRPVVRAYLSMVMLVLGWEAAVIAYYATDSVFVARYMYDLKIAFIAFASTNLFIFTLEFYRIKSRLPKWLCPLLYVMPSITALLCLTSPLHTLMRASLMIDTSGPLTVAHNVRGLWFWVHSAYSYLLIALGMINVLRNHGRQKKGMRMSSSYLLLGMTVSVCCNVITLLDILRLPFDISLVGMAVTAVFLYLSVASSEQVSFLSNARDEIFNYTDDYLFILDRGRQIVDANRAARAWLIGLNLPELRRFSDITLALRQSGAEFRSAADDDRGGTDIHLAGKGRRLILNMIEREIVDSDGSPEGSFVTLADVTGNRGLIERLSTVAGIDALTGLENRYGLDSAKRGMDQPENLPIAIFFGDLNGLKEVNDRLGHKQGDNMLVHASTLLARACPADGRLFRVGGDEFVIIAPRCPEKRAIEVIFEINELMSNIRGYPYRLSMALGYAVKQRPEQDLSALIDEADQKMYTFKRKSREARTIS